MEKEHQPAGGLVTGLLEQGKQPVASTDRDLQTPALLGRQAGRP
jgi:hypothetical protein